MEIILAVVCSLGAIVAFFAYLFVFRLPSAQINQQSFATLQALYADESSQRDRTTLLLRSREPKAGELKAFVAWIKEYEPIDLTRQILPRAFESYYDTVGDKLLWREKWDQSDYGKVQDASNRVFAEKRTELEQEGWEVVFDLPFSSVDHLIYLKKDLPQ